MTKKIPVFLIVLVALTASLCYPGQAEAYYDDMHYHFTYYMARSVGYTPEQSYRIASANVSIDWAPKTEPVQQAGQFAMWGMAADSYALDPSGGQWAKIRNSWVSTPSTPRIKFHAMMDCLNWPLCHSDATHQANALKKIPLYREQIWRSAKANGNLGGFLHFLEDEPAHEGYPSDNGHWAAVDMWWHNHQLRMGSATDYIDFEGNDGNRDTAELINRVIGRMSAFMSMIIPKQQPGNSSTSFSSRAISNVYRDLRRVNPVSNAPGFQDSLNQAAPNFNVDKNGNVSLQGPFLGDYARNFWALWKTGSEPSSQAAYSVIAQALGDQLNSFETNYPYKHFQYDLDANGNPVGQHMVDQWVLAGNLHLDFVFNRDEKQDFSSRSIKVIIRSIPTFEGVKPYVLDQADSLGTMLFEKLPIGAVRIEVYTLGKLLRERTVTLLKEDTYIRLAIDLESEASQLELDKHLERMRVLLTQLKKDQAEFEKTDEETKGIINALNELVSEIKELSVIKTGDGSLSDQARELVELSKRQSDWARQIENGLQSIMLIAEEAQREKDFICSAQATAATIDENTNAQADSATGTSLVKQETLLANAENVFLGVRNSFERFRKFYDRLGQLNKSTPESFSSSLEELYKKAEKNLESMATLYHNIGSAKSEIEDIYEIASHLIDQSLDTLNDEVGRENQLTTSSAFYEELRTPFIDIYRESQDIRADTQAGLACREALDEIAKDWDTILDALSEYEIFYRTLKSGDIKTDSFGDVKTNFEKTSALLQLIKALLNESRQCLSQRTELAGSKPNSEDICNALDSTLTTGRNAANKLDTELFGAQMDAIDDEDAMEQMRQAIPRVSAFTALISRYTEKVTLARDRSANLRDRICAASRRFPSLDVVADRNDIRRGALADLNEIRTLRQRARSWKTKLDGMLVESKELADELKVGNTKVGQGLQPKLAELKARLANTRAAIAPLSDVPSAECGLAEERSTLMADLDSLAARLEELHSSASLTAAENTALLSRAATAAADLSDATVTTELVGVFVDSILNRAAEAERCAGLLDSNTTIPEPEPTPAEPPSANDGWSTGERTDETGGGWSTGERSDEVDPCRGPRPEYATALQNIKRALQAQDLAALAPVVGRLRPECPGDVDLLTALRDQAVALARAEARANQTSMQSAVSNAKTRAQRNKQSWASALGTIQKAINEIERARTGTRSGPTSGTTSTGMGAGKTSTTSASSSDDAFEYRCLIDYPNHLSPEGQGRSYRYYVQKQGEWSTGVPAFTVLQYSGSVNQAPSIPGSRLDGPFYTYDAALAHMERLCPPSRRSTGSVRYQ